MLYMEIYQRQKYFDVLFYYWVFLFTVLSQFLPENMISNSMLIALDHVFSISGFLDSGVGRKQSRSGEGVGQVRCPRGGAHRTLENFRKFSKNS